MDLLGFVAISGVFLVMALVAMIGVMSLCRARCDK